MKTKIVYVLVSSDKDYYLEQVLISAYSLKHHNPSSYICLLVDDLTNERLVKISKIVRKHIDEVVCVELDRSLSNMKKSRVLKTSVRKYISGDYLFIDTDTVITGDLSAIDGCPYDLAAVYDAHVLFAESPYRNMALRHSSMIGNTDLKMRDVYYNSGVIYVKDNVRTQKFYERWNELWTIGARNSVFMDQPSFAMTQNDYPIVNELSGEWNCQLRHGLQYWNNCKVLHYLCTSKNGGKSLCVFQNQSLYKMVRDNGVECIDTRLFTNLMCTIEKSLTDVIVGSDVDFIHDDFVLFLKNQYVNNGMVYRCAKSLYSMVRKVYSLGKR